MRVEVKSTALILAVGGVFLVAFYFLSFPFGAAETGVRREFFAYVDRTKNGLEMADVQPWLEEAPEVKEARRIDKAARFTLLRGEAFDGDQRIPRNELRGRLDDLVAGGKIDCVVLFPEKDARWGDVVPVIDECRKSRVRVVLVNVYEWE